MRGRSMTRKHLSSAFSFARLVASVRSDFSRRGTSGRQRHPWPRLITAVIATGKSTAVMGKNLRVVNDAILEEVDGGRDGADADSIAGGDQRTRHLVAAIPTGEANRSWSNLRSCFCSAASKRAALSPRCKKMRAVRRLTTDAPPLLPVSPFDRYFPRTVS